MKTKTHFTKTHFILFSGPQRQKQHAAGNYNVYISLSGYLYYLNLILQNLKDLLTNDKLTLFTG